MISRKTCLPTAAVYVLAVVAALSMVMPAWAGECFEKGVVARLGHDPVACFSKNKPVTGSPEYKAEHQGSTLHFAMNYND
jgi:hypothetical protein